MTLTEIYRRCSQKGECKLWNGGVNQNGAPMVCPPKKLRDSGLFRQRWTPARAVVWAMKTGERPSGTMVMTCRNPMCLEHSHMAVMSKGDAVRFHAAGGAYKTLKHTISRRSAALKARSKLTNEIVAQIRAAGPFMGDKNKRRAEFVRQMSERYGVNAAVVYDVLGGRAWVTAPLPSSSVWALAAA